MFKLGDKVTWESQAGGGYTKKEGHIARILRGGDNPIQIARNDFHNHRRMFDGFSIPGRAKVGYLVEVIAGPKAKPRLYMPYPSKLKLAD